MNPNKRRKLEARGWRVGTPAEFLGLSSEEAALVETRLALSQSRVARMEAADRSVSIDLLLRGLFALGATPRDVAKALRQRGDRRTVAA